MNRIFNEAVDFAAIPRFGAPWDSKCDTRPPQRQDPKGDKSKEFEDGAHANMAKCERDGTLKSKDKGSEHGKERTGRGGMLRLWSHRSQGR